MARTMFDKVWAEHAVADLGGGVSLLNVDRHLIHDLVAGPAFQQLEARDLRVRNPERTFAMPDHGVTSRPERPAGLDSVATRLLDQMRQGTRDAGVRMFDIGEDGQGIVHVVGPELGLTLPGSLIVCGDSHSCTHGGLGALSFGIGTTEVVHVLATQTIRQRKPKVMRIIYDGSPGAAVTAKDIILFTIGRLGTKAGQGYAIEFAGPAIAALDIEERLTLCNLSIELGAKIGMVAPDDRTFAYLRGKPFAPEGALFDDAVAHWRTLTSDEGARFDVEHYIDIGTVTPQISWGTSPEDVIAIDGHVPDPAAEADPARRQRMVEALDYMGLSAGQSLVGTPVDRVFIGSCANGRLSDLREAARVVEGGQVAARVQAWVVPGSRRVQQAAEAEGLDSIFRAAGFQWREPGCSLCLATAGEHLQPGERSVSTTNRNFVGRQGPGARTHLASPATAAASALAGSICDIRYTGDHA
jgi:3-isopropylmalate/(R)-2-methylmalate dehydratase large subunit